MTHLQLRQIRYDVQLAHVSTMQRQLAAKNARNGARRTLCVHPLSKVTSHAVDK